MAHLKRRERFGQHEILERSPADEVKALALPVFAAHRSRCACTTVLEGVSHGRYAIWTYPAPYAYCVRSYSDLSDAFGQVRRHQEPNTHWAEYVARTFDEDVIYSRWSESFRRASGALL